MQNTYHFHFISHSVISDNSLQIVFYMLFTRNTYSLIYIQFDTNETIQKASKFCATNSFMLQNNHQARKITLIQIELFYLNKSNFACLMIVL